MRTVIIHILSFQPCIFPVFTPDVILTVSNLKDIMVHPKPWQFISLMWLRLYNISSTVYKGVTWSAAFGDQMLIPVSPEISLWLESTAKL